MATAAIAEEDSSDDEVFMPPEPTGASTGAAKDAPASMEQAQRALMTSLKRPRRSYKNLAKDYGAQAEVVASDGRVIKAA